MESILIVEDEKRVADVLSRGLEESGFRPIVAYDGATGLRLFKANPSKVVVSDIVMPGMNGFELCKEVKALHPETCVLLLTALGSTDDKLDGFDAGADDYMTKPFDFRELSARVKALLRRGGSGSGAGNKTRITCADLTIDTSLCEVRRGDTVIRLSPKEYSLLLYMAEQEGRVVSRIEIAEQVWHTRFDTGTNFIDVYINYLRKKIDKPYTLKLIHTKPGIGFYLSDKQ
ncbi:MAG: response regulator transcription factor [Prevotella sp.]|nr:response regulator transcription factor [Prevotella sp.]